MTAPRGRRRLVLQLFSAERSVRRWIDGRAGKDHVGAAGAGVLFHLAGRTGASVGEIARELNSSVSGVSGLIDRLSKAGLVVRASDPDDGRGVQVRSTESGREAAAEAAGVLSELNEHLTAGFSPDELDTVTRWLERVQRVNGDQPSRSAPST
ncbi:MarR family winged helix-turn-helix transcriptional regulator [Myceligenerans indicum]|uniref:Winged helix-turn-helix transcriptional regulator n=1 Tax=Myceligenerans indicum TaxID=2593663 RepID=A0ABS1LSP2_9MICO|nr:MarR family winged helix-turn-helix transcriptional regulator [Myceligenerans indicum]MBL0888828.1 winged helix-turn-helix transcriptional regulator [Myceligenerans indicum]